MKRSTFYGLSTGIYGALLVAFAAIEDVLIRGAWRPFDIESYYGLASSAVPAIYAFLGERASSPMFLLDTGIFTHYRIYIVSALCLASALLVVGTGTRSYGRQAGFLAGLLFTLNMALLQGYLSTGDALALLLALSSAYALFCMEWDKKYLLSGLLAGAAMCFKPLTLVLLPVALLIIYRKGKSRSAPAFIAAAALPVIALTIAAFASLGSDAPALALDSGFEAVGFLADEGSPDLLMAVGNIALSACMLTSILPLALLGFSRERGLREEYCLAAGACFLLTILPGQYLQYWPFALPFFLLLCSSAFRERPLEEAREPLKVKVRAYPAGGSKIRYK